MKTAKTIKSHKKVIKKAEKRGVIRFRVTDDKKGRMVVQSLVCARSHGTLYQLALTPGQVGIKDVTLNKVSLSAEGDLRGEFIFIATNEVN